MVVKRGRFGPFLACTRYPECKGTKPLLQKTGVLCPKDGGEIVERMTRAKRKFYGCANYPACDFTSWQKPLAGLCPVCSGLLVADRNRARCTNCGWKGAREEAVDIEKGVAGTPPPKREGGDGEASEDGEKPARNGSGRGRGRTASKARARARPSRGD
jgi:DNA topoisomerase-1